MRLNIGTLCLAIFICILSTRLSFAEDLSRKVEKAVESSTLNEDGTHPFHLRAEFAPSLDRDSGLHRTGTIEIWWQSSTTWRRELVSPEFQQTLIMNNGKVWEKDSSDYFPDWLRQLAVAIVNPVPIPMEELVQRVKTAETRELHIPNRNGNVTTQTFVNWDPVTTFPDQTANGKGYISLLNDVLSYSGGPGFGGTYHDFQNFHGRQIARTVTNGWHEVKAKITVLEDLGNLPANLLDISASGGTTHPIETVQLSESDLRKNLQNEVAVTWPKVENAPFEGVVWTEVIIDRNGKIRDMIPPISDNPALKDAAESAFRALQFTPVMMNGEPVQAAGRISLHFKTSRPEGMENFDSARNYFEHGRTATYLGAGATKPYVLHATFQTIDRSHKAATGNYTDIWFSRTEWKREVTFESSRVARSSTGGKTYKLEEGPDIALLRLIMNAIEPLPAVDTMTESDWNIRRDIVGGNSYIRVARGEQDANGQLKPSNSEGFWFSNEMQLQQSLIQGFVIRNEQVLPYDGVAVPRRIVMLHEGKIGMILDVDDLSPADTSMQSQLKLNGHEWQRMFTAETR